MRQYGESIVPTIRYQERHGAYGVIYKENQFLITYQSDPFWEFQLPGGGIDDNEGPLQALRREIIEETGWIVNPLRYLTAYRRYVHMPEYRIWARKTHRIYLCSAVRRIGPPLEQGHTAHWMTATKALVLLEDSGDQQTLLYALNNCLELVNCIDHQSM